MQRLSFVCFFLVALYFSACASATPENSDNATPVAASSAVQVAPVSSALGQAQTLSVAERTAPHIALLLPLKSRSAALARAAEVVRQGFATASAIQRGLPVHEYASSDEARDISNLYHQAVADGAVAVVGPLTRDGVATLTTLPDITVPTLALNVSELPASSSMLYFFGLPVENEAREVAQLAIAAKLHDATVISTGSPLSKRLVAAFEETWKSLGGAITGEVLFDGDYSVLTNLPVAPWPEGTEPIVAPEDSQSSESTPSNRQIAPPVAPGNMVFLATEHTKARLIRPYLNPSLPVYATSLVFRGNSNTLANFDLNEIHFVDMPWLLEPDHPAVMIYPRSNELLEPEVDRLYALGIDAYRLINVLQAHQVNSAFTLDGVTGKIHLSGQQFRRQTVPAFFRYGLGLTSETLRELKAAKAAAKRDENAASAVAPTP